MKPIQIQEYSKLRSQAECNGNDYGEDVIIDSRAFDDLWCFILEQQSENSAIECAFRLYSKSNRRIIQAKNYVGIIETRNKIVIEILPKIYKVESLIDSKRIFLKMLASLHDTPFKSFQYASVETLDNFPILEIFIKLYVDEVEKLLISGVKKDYVDIEENSQYIKGRLLFSKDILKNSTDRSMFYTNHKIYLEDIPQNRCIVSTINKLSCISKSTSNLDKLNRLRHILHNISPSNNIQGDLARSLLSNRLFSDYQRTLEWSKVFLLNQSFTNFSGSTINQALLFPMENLFESYISLLFKKYTQRHIINSQHRQYFLVDKHKGNSRFRLRPDIVAEPLEKECEYVIVDTKWKLIDESRESVRDNYNIDIKDIYQLYAYGKKYTSGIDKEPVLYIVYPQTKNFTGSLSPFFYEGKNGKFHLRLIAFPFDLSDSSTYKKQIESILNYTKV